MAKQTYVKDFEQVFSIRGEDIVITSPARFDGATNELLYDQELDDLAIEKAHDVYRENNDYLSSQLIKEIRKKIGISQRDFATLMGWSQTTVVMYENGALPTNNNHNQLKMIYNKPAELNQYYINTKKSLSSKICVKIDNYLLNFKAERTNEELLALDIVDWFRIENVKQMKSSEIAEPLTQLKVMKLLYYAQGIMMAKFNRKLFLDEIIAWDYGPVVRVVYDQYQGKRSIVDELTNDEIPQALIDNYERINQNQNVMEVLNLVQKNFGHLSGISLMQKTHRENPWLETQKNGVICATLIKQYFKENILEILTKNDK